MLRPYESVLLSAAALLVCLGLFLAAIPAAPPVPLAAERPCPRAAVVIGVT